MNFTIKQAGGCASPLLSYTARFGLTGSTVDFLLDNGADIEARDYENATPLFSAVRCCRHFGTADTFIALLKRGASLDHVDDYGRDAIESLAHEDLEFDFARTQEVVMDIKKAGGWKSWAREPRRNLLALRVLCEQGRASPCSISKELLASAVLEAETTEEAKSLARSATCAPLSILNRLFPAAPPPSPEFDETKGVKEKHSYQLQDGAGDIPKELCLLYTSPSPRD